MGAVVVLARTGLRGSRARSLLVFLVLAVSLGFGLFAATGARRTASAFDRFVAWSDPPDAVTGQPGDQTPVGERLDQLAALPAVSDAERVLGVNVAGTVLPDGTDAVPMRFAAAALDFSLDEGFERAKVIDGVASGDLGPDEGIIDFVTAERFGLEVGDRVRLQLGGHPSDEAVEVPVTVVAVVSSPTAIPTVGSYRFSFIALGASFLEEHPWAHDDTTDSLGLRLHGGADGLDDLIAQMEEAGLGDLPVAPPLATAEVGAERIFSLEATAMWAAAVLALVAGLPIAYQLTRREASVHRSTIDTLLAIGASRRQIAVAAAARSAALGAAAAACASGIAVAASPLSPVGLARFAEIDEGVRVDGTVLVVAVPLFVLSAAALGAAGVWRGAFGSSASAAPSRPPVPLAGRLPIAIGARMAGGPRRMGSVAGIGALVMAATLLVGVTVAVRSVQAVPDDAQLAGGVWDAYLGVSPEQRDAVAAVLDDMPEVVAHGAGGWAPIEADGEPVFALSLPQVRGMEPAIARGRAPHARDEVAFGAAVMERLGVDIGDEVQIAPAGGDPQPAIITGESIQASPLFNSSAPDDAALITWDVSDATAVGGGMSELLRFAPGVDPEATMIDVVSGLPEGSVVFYFARGQRGDVIALARLEGLLRALLVMVTALAIATVMHHLLVTVRRHSGSLGTLRALGLTRADVGTIGGALGVTTLAVTAVLAVPLGLALGSMAWRSLARRLVVLPAATINGPVLIVGTIVAILASAVLAVALTRRDARRPVAATLHTE